LNIKKELKTFSEDAFNEDGLSYWKKKQYQFPLLSTLASVILAAPETSVPSEIHFCHIIDLYII